MPELVIYWFNGNRKPLAKIPLPLQTTHPPPPPKKKILATGLSMLVLGLRSAATQENNDKSYIVGPNYVLGLYDTTLVGPQGTTSRTGF